MKLRALLTTGAVAVVLLGTAAAPSAVADQPSAGQLRVAIGSARSQVNEVAADPASNATCTINKITINRFSECEWVTIHVDVIKVINGRPVIEGTVDFDVKHQMTLKANSANWSEKFHVSKARTTRAGKGVAAKIAAASGGGTHLPAGQREITWVKVNENKSQGGTVTAWRGKMHVMDHAPFYVIV